MKAKHKQKALNEQVIVITGGSSGIGLASAKKAGLRGARVVITSNNEIELKRSRDELRSEGIAVESAPADVSDFEALQKVAGIAKDKFGRIDTWINNAGVHIFGEIENNSVEDMRRLFEVNYWGVVNGCRIAVDHMKQAGGTIINLGSILSIESVPLQGIYASSKHAVKAYTDTLRMELDKMDIPINVTLIQPSAMATPIVKHSKNIMDEKAKLPPPLYDPEVTADAILFCAENPRRSFTVGGTGKSINIAAKFFPAASERIMEKIMWPLQKTKGEPREEDNLHEPNVHKPRIRDKKDYFYIRKYSIYDTIVKNPLLSAGLFSLASAFFYLTFFRGSKS